MKLQLGCGPKNSSRCFQGWKCAKNRAGIGVKNISKILYFLLNILIAGGSDHQTDERRDDNSA
jgi:hypothetical protein